MIKVYTHFESTVWSVGTRAWHLFTQAHWAICRSPAGGSKLQNPTKYNGSRSEGNISIVAIAVIFFRQPDNPKSWKDFFNEWPQSLGLFARSDLFEGPSPNSCRGEMLGGGSSKFRENQVYLLLGDRLARHEKTRRFRIFFPKTPSENICENIEKTLLLPPAVSGFSSTQHQWLRIELPTLFFPPLPTHPSGFLRRFHARWSDQIPG